MKSILSLGLAASLILFAGLASAQDSGGVKITGDVTMINKVENITTTSEGASSIASTAVGAVRGNTDVTGDLDMSNTVDTVATTAKGKNSCAETSVGTVGSGPCQ